VLSAALASWAAIEALAPRASIAWLVWPSDADAGPWLRSACLLSAAAAIAGTALHRRRACLAFVPGFILSVGHGVWTLFDGTWSLSHSSYDHAWWGFAPLTLPTSLVVAPGVALALVHPRARWLVAISSVLLVPLIVLFHAAIREPARDIDAVVVLGAGVAPDGTPSAALRDRVTTGVSIATTTGAMLVVVGAGEGLASEPRSMERLALERGVDPSRLVLIEDGIDTGRSMARVNELVRSRGWERIRVVSHGHHLARLRLTCRRLGLRCDATAASQPVGLAAEPYFVVRDAAALAYYAASFWPGEQ
jgi:uncharacterized SAM-binding protein YcdF (DUF218 family)